ncbi:MAG: NUDIX hydrolase [Clostridia bacterium]|nr:NUDIX hydrolase [Clostridia bacterium]
MEFDCGITKENHWFRYRAAAIIVEDNCVLFAGNEVDDYFYSIGGGVHMNESSEEAVIREVFEETGVHYEVDRLAVIHENFFYGNASHPDRLCHEVAFYYLMKPKGSKELHSDSYTSGGYKETVHWIPIDDLDKYVAYPTFMKEYLKTMPKEIVHIISNERK